MSPRKVPPQLYKLNAFGSTRSNLATYSIKESEKESRTSHDTSSDGALRQCAADVSGKAPAFGEDNSLLSSVMGKEGLKRRKPKTNIVKSNSSFISRVIPHEAINKRIQEHNPEGLFVFANINRAFQWLDLSSTNFSKVPMPSSTPVRFSADPSIRRTTSLKCCLAKHICCAMISTRLPKVPIILTLLWELRPQTSCGLKLSRKSTTESIKM